MIGGVLLGACAFAFNTWRTIDRVVIDRSVDLDVQADAPAAVGPDVTAVPEFRLPPLPGASDGIDTVLMVGTDDRSGLEDLSGFGDFEGARADVLLLLIRSRDMERAAIVSLPRDLWVSTPCGQERINETLAGCNGMNGESTLVLTVESLTGLGVDHVAMVNFAGFQDVVDELGGYEICVDRPVRDPKAKLDMTAGCHMADGADTLAWLRSRTTEELRGDGRWVVVSGVNDLTRNERQREFLVEMISRLSDFTGPEDAFRTARGIAPYLTVDSSLGIGQAVSLAWTMRGMHSSLDHVQVPVEDYLTQAGAEVLLPVGSVEAIIADIIAVETVGEPGPPGAATG
ncbi:hypothetical protein BH23ACT5_BH23ACT5_19330 [soil metagenome]